MSEDKPSLYAIFRMTGLPDDAYESWAASDLTISKTDFLRIPNMVDRSDAVAEFWHLNQYRFDGVTPYIVHPRAVAANVKGLLEKQVANLHDILEDTKCTAYDLLQYGFSEEVVAAVQILTKQAGRSYEDYLALVKANPLAKAVKIADMLANLNDTPTKNQVKKYAKGLQFLLT